MKMSTVVVAILMAVACVGQISVAFAQEPPPPKPEQKPDQQAATVDGNWIMSLEGPQGPMQVSMVLKQEGTKVTGSLTSQMGETALEGTFEAGKLAFAIAFEGGSGTMEIYFAAELKEDGTLAGVLSGPMGDMPWVAERAK
ncbi:MAG: hypothetical protein AB1806_09575 [Acidobacteriota bacterium]